MSSNNLLLQILADNLGIPVLRPSMPETSALGAAIVGKHKLLSNPNLRDKIVWVILKCFRLVGTCQKYSEPWFSWPSWLSARCRRVGYSSKCPFFDGQIFAKADPWPKRRVIRALAESCRRVKLLGRRESTRRRNCGWPPYRISSEVALCHWARAAAAGLSPFHNICVYFVPSLEDCLH